MVSIINYWYRVLIHVIHNQLGITEYRYMGVIIIEGGHSVWRLDGVAISD